MGTGAIEVVPLTPGWIDIGRSLDHDGLIGKQVFTPVFAPVVGLRARGMSANGLRAYEEDMGPLEEEVERFLLCLRLFRPTSAQSVYQFNGFDDIGSSREPVTSTWEHNATSSAVKHMSGASEILTLDESQVASFESFERLYIDVLADAQSAWEGSKLATAGVQIGTETFIQSYEADSWRSSIPGLVSTLEGWLLPDDPKEAIVFRIKSRMSLLLQNDAYSVESIFGQIDALYALRSWSEHAVNVTTNTFYKTLGKAAMSDDKSHGLNEVRAVESLREMVRKVICARLILADPRRPVWKIGDRTSIDRRLLDDTYRSDARTALVAGSEDYGLGLFDPPKTHSLG